MIRSISSKLVFFRTFSFFLICALLFNGWYILSLGRNCHIEQILLFFKMTECGKKRNNILRDVMVKLLILLWYYRKNIVFYLKDRRVLVFIFIIFISKLYVLFNRACIHFLKLHFLICRNFSFLKQMSQDFKFKKLHVWLLQISVHFLYENLVAELPPTGNAYLLGIYSKVGSTVHPGTWPESLLSSYWVTSRLVQRFLFPWGWRGAVLWFYPLCRGPVLLTAFPPSVPLNTDFSSAQVKH